MVEIIAADVEHAVEAGAVVFEGDLAAELE